MLLVLPLTVLLSQVVCDLFCVDMKLFSEELLEPALQASQAPSQSWLSPSAAWLGVLVLFTVSYCVRQPQA